MPRHVRLILGLAALAAVYWTLGGFDALRGPGDDDLPHLPSSRAELADSNLSAMGGPDDLFTAGPSQTAAGLESQLLDSAVDPLRAALPVTWEQITIERNESFYAAMQRSGLDHPAITALVSATRPHTDLRRVRRGDVFHLRRDDQTGSVQELRFDLDPERYLVVQSHQEDGFRARVLEHPIQRVVNAAQGTIRTNLFDALKQAGASIVLADQLAEILGWDIDFFRDLRRGDSFVVLYEQFENQGQIVRDPQVIAVHFVNDGREVRAYRHADAHGLNAYYRPDGTSLERQFLRAPLKFSRISSGFSNSRLHPVLKQRRPHYGVDFVAPTGTPVMATADGTVIKRTRDEASGNFVGLRHGNGFETYYLHLSRFAKDARVGGRVRQGQVIGYVGSTGWSTGAHLDYRVKKNGQWINPRKMILPPAAPLPEEELAVFAERVAEFDALIAAVPADRPTLVLDASDASAMITR